MRGALIGLALFVIFFAFSLYVDHFHLGCGGRWLYQPGMKTCQRCGKRVKVNHDI
jgi:hypothetical protein